MRIILLAFSLLACGSLIAKDRLAKDRREIEKPSDDKRITQDKGYHYTHPKNMGPTPDNMKDTNSDKNAKRQRNSELDDLAPPTRTPEAKDTKPTP